MDNEQLYTVIGTTTDPSGVVKLRWASDIVARVKNLVKHNHTRIKLVELPMAMNKLDSAKYLRAHYALTAETAEVVDLKIAEKTRTANRTAMKATITNNSKPRIKSKKAVGPNDVKFVESELEKVE